jgi:hypothetical protein
VSKDSLVHVASSPLGTWTHGSVCRLIGFLLLIVYVGSFFLPVTNTPDGPPISRMEAPRSGWRWPGSYSRILLAS